MNANTLRISAALALVALGGAGLAAANEDSAFSASAELERVIAQLPVDEVAPERTIVDRIPESTPDIESFVPLREALELALRNNLDVALVRLEPEISAETVEQAKSAFDPVGTLSFDFGQAQTPIASTFEGDRAIENDRWSYQAGVRGLLPFGLVYTSGMQLERDENDSAIIELEREVRSRWVTDVTLPLMRDFGMNQAKMAVIRSQVGQDLSEFALATRLSGLLVGVETLYWDLAAARAGVNVARKSLQAAEDLLERVRREERLGTASAASVLEAEAGVAERELLAIQAESAAGAAKDALLSALLAPDADAYEDRDLVLEAPVFYDYPVSQDAAIARALGQRPELAEARRRVEAAEAEEAFASNQAQPRLDLRASYSVAALRGRSKDFKDTVLGGAAVGGQFLGGSVVLPGPNDPASPESEGSGSDSLEDFFRARGSRSYNLGLQFEVPFGNNAARSLERQRGIEVRRAKTLLRREEQRVILEVRNAVRGVENAAKAVQAGERRRSVVQRRLETEQQRLRLGDSTPFQTLQFEEELAEAERLLIDALRQYRVAISRVEQAQGTLLEARGVSIED